ncbi:hypothetical protein EV424DRAFT_1349694 [Suillus variegatus]|nr:hypothetical protein EV424DRAFT_1349694 [Suillus variegatus]
MFQEDPNDAIVPDFASKEHQLARQRLIQDGLMEDHAAHSLASLWTIANNVAKERWATRQRQLAEVRSQKEEDEEQHLELLQEEEEATKLEERKKNKNKYTPLRCGKISSDPSVIPVAYAIQKMKAGNFCELHYFTNKGLNHAKAAKLIVELEALVMLPEANGTHMWVPAAAVRDPKAAAVTKDENLSWEEFNEATPQMISMMRI